MTLTGRLIKNTAPLRDATVVRERASENEDFRTCLEESFRQLCKALEISIPLWLKKNTSELGRFRRTFFPADQFLEPVQFDRFELTLEE